MEFCRVGTRDTRNGEAPRQPRPTEGRQWISACFDDFSDIL